jgi:hypothetical protein
MAPEQRSMRRYALSLPVKVIVPSQDAAAPFNGTVQDISSNGVYFLCEETPPVGAQIRMLIDFAAGTNAGVNAFIDALATVMRVEDRSERGETRVGIAAAMVQCELTRSDKN